MTLSMLFGVCLIWPLPAAAKHADIDPKNFSDMMARDGLRRTAAGAAGDGGLRRP